MNAVCLSFYTYELQKHHGMVLYEWLLEFAKKNGISGGSVFRAIAGYGRHGHVHEEHFFELASNVPVQIVFIAEKDKTQHFLDKLKSEKLSLFYTISEVYSGFLSP